MMSMIANQENLHGFGMDESFNNLTQARSGATIDLQYTLTINGTSYRADIDQRNSEIFISCSSANETFSKGQKVDGKIKLSMQKPGYNHDVINKRHMLVLSRQENETIIIGDNIRVTVLEVRGDKVRLGIEAPRDVTVHRQEVYDAIRRENEGNGNKQPS